LSKRCLKFVKSAGRPRGYFFLKNWTARSCLRAAASEEKVPRFRRLPVFVSFFREYRRYSPDFSLRIMAQKMQFQTGTVGQKETLGGTALRLALKRLLFDAVGAGAPEVRIGWLYEMSATGACVPISDALRDHHLETLAFDAIGTSDSGHNSPNWKCGKFVLRARKDPRICSPNRAGCFIAYGRSTRASPRWTA
jgi:hypothetical protein